jgi:hypothetical protein
MLSFDVLNNNAPGDVAVPHATPTTKAFTAEVVEAAESAGLHNAHRTDDGLDEFLGGVGSHLSISVVCLQLNYA